MMAAKRTSERGETACDARNDARCLRCARNDALFTVEATASQRQARCLWEEEGESTSGEQARTGRTRVACFPPKSSFSADNTRTC